MSLTLLEVFQSPKKFYIYQFLLHKYNICFYLLFKVNIKVRIIFSIPKKHQIQDAKYDGELIHLYTTSNPFLVESQGY